MTMLNPILLAVILALVAAVWYYQDASSAYQYRIEAYEIQIGSLKRQAEEMTKRYETARIQSLEDIKRSQEKSKEIMNTPIGPGCDAAIQFGRRQAKVFDTISK